MFRRIVSCIVMFSVGCSTMLWEASAFAAGVGMTQVYNYAKSGNLTALKQTGAQLESVDRYGNTALCRAILANDYSAFYVLKTAGASTTSPCVSQIPDQLVDSFNDGYLSWAQDVNAGRVANPLAIRTAASRAGTNNAEGAVLATGGRSATRASTEAIATSTGLSTGAKVGIGVGAVALIGGGIALAAGGGGGGSKGGNNESNGKGIEISDEPGDHGDQGSGSGDVSCPANTYRQDKNCIDCPTNSISPAGSVDISACQCDTANGYVKQSDGTCVKSEPEVDLCANVDCGEHGSCNAITGRCVCSGNWNPNTYCSTCADGYHEVDGTCVKTATEVDLCANVNCGKHGSCNAITGRCVCDNGYEYRTEGIGCTAVTPAGCNGVNEYWDGHSCQVCLTGKGNCACAGNWRGTDCQTCSLKGSHVNTSRCSCEDGYIEDDDEGDTCIKREEALIAKFDEDIGEEVYHNYDDITTPSSEDLEIFFVYGGKLYNHATLKGLDSSDSDTADTAPVVTAVASSNMRSTFVNMGTVIGGVCTEYGETISTSSLATAFVTLPDNTASVFVQNEGIISASADFSLPVYIDGYVNFLNTNTGKIISTGTVAEGIHSVYEPFDYNREPPASLRAAYIVNRGDILVNLNAMVMDDPADVSVTKGVGAFVENSTFINDISGRIIVSGDKNADGNALYGIFGVNSTIINNGTIELVDAKASPIVLEAFSNIWASMYGGAIAEIPDNVVYAGILALGGTVYNNGTITINGSSYNGNTPNESFIVLADGATLLTSGTLSSDGVLNLSSFSSDGTGSVSLLSGGAVEAPSISGDLHIDKANVVSGFEKTYTLMNAVQSADTTGLNLISDSVLFNAGLAENGTDVVMTMKSFDSVIENRSLSAFLSNNYAAGMNESFFNTLKSFETREALTGALNAMSSLDTLSRFTSEDLTVMREVNLAMNDMMFAHNNDRIYEANGALNTFGFKNDKGTASQFALGNKRIGSHIKVGYAMSKTDMRTDDNHETTRRNSLFQVAMPIGYRHDGWQMITTPQLGYARAHYSRDGYQGSYDGIIEKRIFALMNEARYPLSFGEFEVSPTLEFNAIAYNRRGSEEAKAFALRMPSDNSLSVEAGVGLRAKQSFGKLDLTAGVAAYREFADPYSVKLGMEGMNGTFELTEDVRAYRGKASFGWNYKSGTIDMYGLLNHYMQRDGYTTFKTGLKFNF